MKDTTDYKIISIIKDFIETKSFDKKDDVLVLLMKLKESLEFNATINWFQIYTELGNLYNDNKPYYRANKYTPELIENLLENEIFVFGSNNEGKHGAGAAKTAYDKFGAIYGQSKGLMGQSYGIITKDLKKGQKSIELNNISEQIDELLSFAVDNKNLIFYVTKIACDKAGYSINEIGPLFANKVIPINVILPIEFVNTNNWYNYLYSKSKNKFYKIKNNTLTILSPDEPGINFIENIENITKYIQYSDIVASSEDDYKTALSYTINKINQKV